MSSTFSSLKFEIIGNGEQSGTWGTTTNTNIGTAIEQAIVGMATLESADFTANVCTLTLSNTNAAQDARALCLNIAAGAVSAAGTINVPAIEKPYLVINGSSYAVTVKVSGQTGVSVPAGTRTIVYNNGTDVGTQLNWLNSLTLGTALPVASGGTGATTASGARTALSAQETLVSGTSIKTVNGTSLLGSGNIATNTAATPSVAGVVYAKQDTASAYQAFGYLALDARTTGEFNTALGQQALWSTTTGSQNTAAGHQALLFNITGSTNTAYGYQTLYQTTASHNTALGNTAGSSNTTGAQNTFLGSGAGGTTTGSNNTCIGYGATVQNALTSNVITLGNSSITTLRCQVTTITSLSDQRDKTGVTPIGDALNLIRNIAPVRFVWNMRDGGKVGAADTGFIAQQLLEAQQASDMHIPGLVDETNPDKLEAGYGKLIPVLVKALQQLDAEFQAYKLSHP